MTYGLGEKILETLIELVQRYCTFGLEFKDKDGYTQDWKTLVPALEIAYNSSIHSATNQKLFELERGYCPGLPNDSLRNKIVHMHLMSLSFAAMLNRARACESHRILEATSYNEIRWDKTHNQPDFKVGYQVLISTFNFGNFPGSKKLQESFFGPFLVTNMYGKNAVDVMLTEQLGWNTQYFQFPY